MSRNAFTQCWGMVSFFTAANKEPIFFWLMVIPLLRFSSRGSHSDFVSMTIGPPMLAFEPLTLEADNQWC